MAEIKAREKIEKIEQALHNLANHEKNCRLCPRECEANRQNGEEGFCESSSSASISHATLHFGEEPLLSGHYNYLKNSLKDPTSRHGSGTIFFTGCNLKCVFCQNFQLSWYKEGNTVSSEKLAEKMLRLQEQGALNINLVSPSHMILPILKALKIAYLKGLSLPLVYNSNAYEKVEVLRNLEGIVDIYLPDFKYFSSHASAKYSGAFDYFQHASQAIKEMYCQQPVLVLNSKKVAQKGLIIRHLVLPGQTGDSIILLEWMSKNLSLSVCLSIMSQYYPCFKAPPEIQRTLTRGEYVNVVSKAKELGFENMLIQPEPFARNEHLIPDFNIKDPFRWK